jgi:manganese transport protein
MAAVTALIIVALNVRLVMMTISEWLAGAGGYRTVILVIVVPLAVGLGLLLLWIALEPLIRRRRPAPALLPEAPAPGLPIPVYRRIMVPLDHSHFDRAAISHAAAVAHTHGARLYLLHVEEGVTSQVYGPLSSTAEVEAGGKYLERIAETLRSERLEVETAVLHSSSPRTGIVQYARQIQPDLLIMSAHGHGRLKDLIFGNTIDPVRHKLNVPILVVRPDSGEPE